MKTKAIAAVLALTLSPLSSYAGGFYGGVCSTQGNWLNQALEQSSAIVKAINNLKDDESCTAMVKVLESTPNLGKVDGMKQEVGGFSSATFFRELQAVRDYMNPGSTALQGMTSKDFQSMVNYLVFRKSYDAINEIQLKTRFDNLSDSQKSSVDIVSTRLRRFHESAKEIAAVSVATTQAILSAYPKSLTCFHNKPNDGLMILSAVINSGAALLTGGEVTQFGQLISSLTTFARELDYMKAISLPKKMEFFNSVSCLVETTQEAYCALHDGSEALEFMREHHDSLESTAGGDPLKSPMGGLIILLRDVPTVTLWLQKILFGIDPKLELEAQMKNAGWAGIFNFITDQSTLPAILRDKANLYFETTKGKDISIKQAQVKSLIQDLTGTFYGGGRGGRNFFTSAVNPELIPFFLLGIEEFPEGYNSQMRGFDTFFAEWSKSGERGLNNPDKLLETIESQMFKLIERASAITNDFFSSRLIVDPHNLFIEGMNGPAISPYKAMNNIRDYSIALIEKLDATVKASPNNKNRVSYQATINLLKDTVLRLDKMIAAIETISNEQGEIDLTKNKERNREAMNAIYEYGNMLISRDSLIANRITQAVRMDISHTLWENQHISNWQSDLLKTLGRDVILRLSRYFSDDPVIQGLDIAAAKPIHNANLMSVENLFARSMYEFIQTVNCTITGDRTGSCVEKDMGFDPARSWFSNVLSMTSFFSFHNPLKPISGMGEKIQRDDSKEMFALKAKLCIQTLGFESRENFARVCKDSVLESYFARPDKKQTGELNMSYNDQLKAVQEIQKAGGPGSFDKSRTAGVCSLRSYLRKNHVYRMYLDYAEAPAPKTEATAAKKSKAPKVTDSLRDKQD